MQGVDNNEYARWVVVIGRSMRINPPVRNNPEQMAAKAFVTYEFGRRTWLRSELFGNSEQLQGLIPEDNPQVVGRQLVTIGDDMEKILLMDAAEKAAVDVLIAATGDRRYGKQGGGIGSDVTIP